MRPRLQEEDLFIPSIDRGFTNHLPPFLQYPVARGILEVIAWGDTRPDDIVDLVLYHLETEMLDDLSGDGSHEAARGLRQHYAAAVEYVERLLTWPLVRATVKQRLELFRLGYFGPVLSRLHAARLHDRLTRRC